MGGTIDLDNGADMNEEKDCDDDTERTVCGIRHLLIN